MSVCLFRDRFEFGSVEGKGDSNCSQHRRKNSTEKTARRVIRVIIKCNRLKETKRQVEEDRNVLVWGKVSKWVFEIIRTASTRFPQNPSGNHNRRFSHSSLCAPPLIHSFPRLPKDPGTPRRRTKRQRLQCCIWVGNRLVWIVPGSFPCRWRKRVSSGRVKRKGEPRKIRMAFMAHLFQGSPLFFGMDINQSRKSRRRVK